MKFGIQKCLAAEERVKCCKTSWLKQAITVDLLKNIGVEKKSEEMSLQMMTVGSSFLNEIQNELSN